MLRVFSLTCALLATTTVTAHANGQLASPARSIEMALYQTPATTGKGQRSAENAPQLQVGGALALSQPSVRARVAGSGSHRYAAPQLLSGREEVELPAVVRWLDLRGSKPGLAYPVTGSLSLGFRYTFQRGEDLVFRVAKTGALHDDYASHNVLLRAQWEF